MIPVIVLAGGFGTRLRALVSDVPKPMAPVAGRPFLEYVLHHLWRQQVKEVVLAVGYKHETISSYFGQRFGSMQLTYSVEHEPLGTGGAIRQAMELHEGDEFLILNGDTLFLLPLNDFLMRSRQSEGALCMALKYLSSADRFGFVETDAHQRLIGFVEKGKRAGGTINAGVYYLRRQLLDRPDLPRVFSFEKNVLEAYVGSELFFGFCYDSFFLDIGIPDDYLQAQQQLPLAMQWPAPALSIDKSWSLFLDRDGVLNKKKPGDYIRNVAEFEWLPGACEAAARLSQKFGHTFVVTNQQGVGKGLMTMTDVQAIHRRLEEDVRNYGGTITRIYVAPQLASAASIFRKPMPGMALQAQADFPQVDFRKSVMIGDSLSDMEFGKAVGMYTVFLHADAPPPTDGPIDFVARNLAAALSLF